MSSPFPPPTVKIYGVSELTRSIKNLLEEAHGNVWVEGEVSNLSKPTSGHIYLTLKDDEAPLGAVIYRSSALRMRFDLRDGMRVIARGKLTVYPPQGKYQLQAEEIQPKGVGPLELAFRQLKEKLSIEGLFHPDRKKKHPRLPRRIAIVTSPTGSAVRDMLEIIGQRWPIAEVWIYPVRVQGEGAAREIADAVRRLNELGGVDVMIVGRGGGSLEDLWAFNEEIVARAIAASRIPVVSGVGHEDDLTIADLVADVRAPTPTAAAQTVTPDRREVLDWLEEKESAFRRRVFDMLDLARSRLTQIAGRRCFRAPLDRIRETERRLDESSDRLGRSARLRLEESRRRLTAETARLESLSPLNVLARGYSLTLRQRDGGVVRSTTQVQPGDRLRTRVADGEILSQVDAD
jgi:exodeoxyribonuclease VII large subunit